MLGIVFTCLAPHICCKVRMQLSLFTRWNRIASYATGAVNAFGPVPARPQRVPLKLTEKLTRTMVPKTLLRLQRYAEKTSVSQTEARRLENAVRTAKRQLPVMDQSDIARLIWWLGKLAPNHKLRASCQRVQLDAIDAWFGARHWGVRVHESTQVMRMLSGLSRSGADKIPGHPAIQQLDAYMDSILGCCDARALAELLWVWGKRGHSPTHHGFIKHCMAFNEKLRLAGGPSHKGATPVDMTVCMGAWVRLGWIFPPPGIDVRFMNAAICKNMSGFEGDDLANLLTWGAVLRLPALGCDLMSGVVALAAQRAEVSIEALARLLHVHKQWPRCWKHEAGLAHTIVVALMESADHLTALQAQELAVLTDQLSYVADSSQLRLLHDHCLQRL